MAKKSMIARDTKRTKLNKKHHAKRLTLKATVSDETVSFDERWEAIFSFFFLSKEKNKHTRN